MALRHDRPQTGYRAEFFAVATETFFELPQQLLSKHAALYEQLQRYYQLDPVQWV